MKNKAIAWAVQVEQTIEFPMRFITDPYIKGTINGRLETLEPMEKVLHIPMLVSCQML